MVFVVLRHGESEWNKLNKFTGLTNVALSEQGKQEARLAGNLLKNCFFDFVFSSQLERTIHTAKIIADEYNKTSSKISSFSILFPNEYSL